MTNKPTANFAEALICDGCGKTIEAKPGETYMGSTNGRVWHYGCRPSAQSSTPQEPDDDAEWLLGLAKAHDTWLQSKTAERLRIIATRLQAKVPETELVAENRQLRADVGRLGIGLRHALACMDTCEEAGGSPAELDPQDRALIDETRRELVRIAGDEPPNPPYSGIVVVDEADFTRGEE